MLKRYVFYIYLLALFCQINHRHDGFWSGRRRGGTLSAIVPPAGIASLRTLSCRWGPTLRFWPQLYLFGDNFGAGVFAALWVLPVPCLQASLYQNRTALMQILGDDLGLPAPRNNTVEFRDILLLS